MPVVGGGVGGGVVVVGVTGVVVVEGVVVVVGVALAGVVKVVVAAALVRAEAGPPAARQAPAQASKTPTRRRQSRNCDLNTTLRKQREAAEVARSLAAQPE